MKRRNELKYLYWAPIIVYFCNSISDIDECTSGIAKCSQRCNNGLGNYICDCLPGYSLAEDQRECNGKLEEC